jgi:hypothetical protein
MIFRPRTQTVIERVLISRGWNADQRKKGLFLNSSKESLVSVAVPLIPEIPPSAGKSECPQTFGVKDQN